jgi:diacylglycerol kinase family enzyme
MNYCGLGFDVATLQRSDKLRGKVPRKMIYFLSLLITLFSFRFKHVRLKWENGSFDGEIFMMNMANGRFYGNGLPFSPHSSVSDGILDVCLIKKLPRIMIPFLLVLFLMGKHERVTKYVQFLHVKEITLEADETETMASDGNLFTASAVCFSAGEQIRVFTASGVK